MTIFHISISLYILILNSLLIFKLIKNKKKVVIAEIFALSFSILIFIFLDNIPEFSFNKFNLIQFLYLAITSAIIFILYLHLKFIFFNKLILNNFLNLNDFGSLIDFFFLFIITSLVVFLITESTYSTYDKYIVSVILLYLISIFTTIFLFIPILLIYSIVSNLNLKNILKNNIKKEFNKILNNKNKNIIINKLFDIEFQYIMFLDNKVCYKINTNVNIKFINTDIINKSNFLYLFNDNLSLDLKISSIDISLNNIPYGLIPLNKLNFKPLNDYIDLLNDDLEDNIENIISLLKIENY